MILPELVGDDERLVAQANAIRTIGGAGRRLARRPGDGRRADRRDRGDECLYVDAGDFPVPFVTLALFVPKRPLCRATERGAGASSQACASPAARPAARRASA